MSQLSISKEAGSTTTKKKKADQPFKPYFSKVSDRVFKQILGNAIEGGNQLVQCLNTDEKIQFVHQMTELTNQVQYLDLQRHLWQDYYSIGLKEGRWAPHVSKSFAEQHQLCRSYDYSRRSIQKRLQTIQHDEQRICQVSQLSMQTLDQYSKQCQPFFNANDLSQAIIECVKKSQRRLGEEFELKRKVLQFDANDHHFIRAFYQCKPNREQVCSVDSFFE